MPLCTSAARVSLGEALSPDAIVEIGLVPTGYHNKGPDSTFDQIPQQGFQLPPGQPRNQTQRQQQALPQDKKTPSKIRDGKQSRIMLTDVVEQINEILYAILANKERSLCK